MDNLKKQDIIIQLGSQSIRVGLVGDRSPRKTFPTGSLLTFNQNQHKSQQQYQIKIQQTIYNIFFAYINCSCQGKTVIILENVFTDRKILQIMAKIMFNKLKIQKLELALCCITPLYLTAKYSGIIISSGANSSEIMPVFQSYPLFRNFKSSNIGTHSINKRIRYQLALLNNQIKTQQIFNQMTDQYLNQLRNIHSIIPCQSDIITINFKRNKLKFNPKVIDFTQIYGNIQKQQFNLAYQFTKMLNQVPISCLNQICNNIIFAGGLWRIKGMQNYFKKNVSQFLKYKQFKKLQRLNIKDKLKFVSWGFNPSQVAWIGCSIGCSVRNIEHMCLKRSQYIDSGFIEKIMQNYFCSS